MTGRELDWLDARGGDPQDEPSKPTIRTLLDRKDPQIQRQAHDAQAEKCRRTAA